MLIADSHEFIELYRGDKDLRMGMELIKLGKDVKFVSFAPDKASPNDRDRFGCRYLDEIGVPELPEGFDLRLLDSLSIRFKKKDSGGVISCMPKYSSALRAVDPDIILENPFSWLTPRSYKTYIYSKRNNVPIVYYDPGDDIPISRKHRIMAHWETPVVQHASAIITYNQAGCERFVRKYNYPREKIHIIPKPVDVPSCLYEGDVTELRRSFGAREDTLVVGYLGRLAQYKGSAILLAVAQRALVDERMKDILFVFIGGALASSEKEYSYDLRNTHVTGMVPHDRVPEYLAACDVLVYPKQDANMGGFSTSVAETMAAGKAIVLGTDKTGYYVPLEDGVTARIVPPDSPREIAEALVGFVSNREQVGKLGNAVGDYARSNMDYSVVAGKYYDILQTAVNAPMAHE